VVQERRLIAAAPGAGRAGGAGVVSARWRADQVSAGGVRIKSRLVACGSSLS